MFDLCKDREILPIQRNHYVPTGALLMCHEPVQGGTVRINLKYRGTIMHTIAMNESQTEKGRVVTIELPGAPPRVTIRGRILRIEAKRDISPTSGMLMDKTLYVPEDCDVDSIHVQYEHGICTIAMPFLPVRLVKDCANLMKENTDWLASGAFFYGEYLESKGGLTKTGRNMQHWVQLPEKFQRGFQCAANAAIRGNMPSQCYHLYCHETGSSWTGAEHVPWNLLSKEEQDHWARAARKASMAEYVKNNAGTEADQPLS